MLQLDVPPYHFRCHLIPNRSHKVPIVPQLSSPQLLPHYWISPEYFPRRHTLENLYQLTRAVLRRTFQEHMDVILHHLHRINLQLVSLCNPLKHFLQSLSHLSLKNQFSILGNPNKMVLQIVNRMLSTLHSAHASYRNTTIRLRRISTFLPPASWRVSSGGPL